MKSIVITGADGFIGSHLAAYISRQDYKVYAVVMPESPTKNRIEGIKNVVLLEGDIACFEELGARLPREDVSALIHLAWAGVSPEARQSTELQAENIDLALNAVRLANLVKAERFVFPGSTLEYSYCGQLINETAVPSPQNAYGAAKISARYMCEALCRELSVPFVYAVLTGIYGANRNDNNVITYCIRELLQGNKPQFTKLEQKWDYIHIDDLANAMFLIATKGKNGAFYSVGHGDNWPLANYIDIIRGCIDPKLPVGIGELPYPNNRLPSSCMDLTRLCEDTGFAPAISFEDGIKPVIQQIRLQLERG